MLRFLSKVLEKRKMDWFKTNKSGQHIKRVKPKSHIKEEESIKWKGKEW